jgi:Phosphodiester glycosidase
VVPWKGWGDRVARHIGLTRQNLFSEGPGHPVLHINQRNEISIDEPKGKGYNAISGDLMLRSYGLQMGMALDGGGSSTMVIEGVDRLPRVLNMPIDDNNPGQERAVANHLGI